MIYKPTNVYPNGNTTDANIDVVEFLKFTFNGDELKYISFRMWDANTGIGISDYYYGYLGNIYNGETVGLNLNIGGTFINGNNYKYDIRLYQEKYNIFILQGRLRKVVSNVVYVNWGINAIKPPVYYSLNNVNTLFGGMYIEIGNERRFISDVDYSQIDIDDDGNYVMGLVIDSEFSTAIENGSQYRIYSNYIISAEYLYKARTNPVITVNAVYDETDGTISCSGTYSQEQKVGIKSFQYKLYKQTMVNDKVITGTMPNWSELDNSIKSQISSSNIYLGSNLQIPKENLLTINRESRHILKYNITTGIANLDTPLINIPAVGTTYSISNFKEELIDQSDIVYSGRMTYKFSEIPDSTYYRICFRCCTQDDVWADTSVIKNFNKVTGIDVISYYHIYEHKIRKRIAWWYNDNYAIKQVNVYREEIGRDKLSMLYNVKTLGNFTDDFLVAANKQYRYHIMPILTDGSIGSIVTTELSLQKQTCWSIFSIEKQDYDFYNQKVYRAMTEDKVDENNSEYVGGVWYFEINAKSGDIVQNINTSIHTGGTATYPKGLTSGNNYVSGTLTTEIGSINCPSMDFKDDIEKVEAWRKFIAQENLFVLKSPKGDVWIVCISDNPTTNYDNTTPQLFTTISFSFTECEDKDNIVIKRGED